MNPIISVIIPTYNEEKDIADCLKSLGKQSFKKTEIIVVDDGSTDHTKEVIKKFNKVKLINGEHLGPGYSRNIGAKIAKGRILVFIDSDMEFDKDYIKNLARPILLDKNVIGSTHELEIVKNIDNIWSRCWGRVRVSKEEAEKVKIFRAIRKNKFLELGGVDTKYGYADDQTFWFKYKIKPVVAIGSVCYHKNPENLKQVYRQSKWIGASHNTGIIKLAGMIILLPLFIPILVINKCRKNKDWIVGAMLVFMIARYFGNLAGYLNKLVWKKNFK